MLVQEWRLLPTGLAHVLENPLTVAAVAVGGLLGLLAGILPGISAVMAMALLLGVTFRLPLDAGLGMLVGIYSAAIYAGSVTAIMLNIPGTPAAAATCLDGFAMARQGKAREAIGIATGASFIGEICGELGTLVFLPLIALLALRLGDWEIFLVAIVGVTLAGALGGQRPLKGWIAAFTGILLSMVGTDPIWGFPRFGYTPELTRGIGFVPVLIGLFGLAEVFYVLREQVPYQLTGEPGRMITPWRLFWEKRRTVLRSVLVGLGVGVVPGVGESVAPWVAYDVARRGSKEREQFGKGTPEGVMAPEVANNATSGGALIPMLVLGIPGSGPTAILMAALFMYGVRPGPLLILEEPGFIGRVVVLFWLSAVVFRLLAWLLSPYFIRLLSMRREVILPAAVTLGALGAWGAGFTRFDVQVMLVFGVVGYLMRLRGYPLAPMVLGLLVGPVADRSLRRAILTYASDPLAMLLRPVGLLLILFLAVMLYSQFRGRRSGLPVGA